MKQISKRLLPGQDVKRELKQLITDESIQAGVIVSAVGSLRAMCIRLADGKTEKTLENNFEIVSITGTVGCGDCHVHIAVADQDGHVIGGHVKEGCIVHTTVELVLLAFDGVQYARAFDAQTGYDELSVL